MPSPAGPPAALQTLQEATRRFLDALGVVEDTEQLEQSARCVAEAWSRDLLGGYQQDPGLLLTPFPAGDSRGLVLVRDVEFTSLCVHHLLPFFGVAHIAYLPGDHLTGISKLARVVDALARRLQIQERMTQQVLDTLNASLAPRGAAVILEAEHLCMTARGVRQRGSRVVTAAWSGLLRDDPGLRRDVQEMLGRT
jgi:GTP cyclohydrolase IA